MKVGISTASFFPMYTEDTLPLIAQYGAQTCEVFFEAEAEYNMDFARQLKRTARQLGLAISSVHAFCATFEPFLFSHYERRRQDMLSTFERVVKAAQAAGASYYTFHGDRRTDEIDSLDYRAYQRYFEELLSIAEAHGITLAWENVCWCQSSRPEFIRRIQQYVDPARLHYTLDIKQARRAGIPADDYLAVMGKNLVNVHINDFDDSHDCLLPGRGQEDFAALTAKLNALGYNGNLVIEVYRSNFKEYSEIKAAVDHMKQFV